MAIETVFSLTDRDAVKRFGRILSGVSDTEIDALIPAASQAIAEALGLQIERKSRTVDFDVEFDGQGRIDLGTLAATSITSVTWDPTREFTGTTLQAELYSLDDRDYNAFLQLDLWLPAGRKTLRVVFNGGIAATLQALRSYAPAIEMATKITVKDWLDRRRSLSGEMSISEQGGSVRTEAVKLLPIVHELLRPFHRKVAF